MIEEMIDKELRTNDELLSLLHRHEQLGEKIDKFDEEATKNYKSNLKLYITAIISYIITLSLFVFLHNGTLLPVMMTGYVTYASKKKLNEEYAEDAEKINKMIDNYNEMVDEIKGVTSDICNNMVERFNRWAEEAAILIRERKYDEIIQNYKKYENVIILLDENYSFILTLLITKAQEGAKSIDDLSEEEKMILYYMADDSKNDKVPFRKLQFDDLIIEDLEESSDLDNSNSEKSKTYTKKKPS